MPESKVPKPDAPATGVPDEPATAKEPSMADTAGTTAKATVVPPKAKRKAAKAPAQSRRVKPPGSRRWVPPTFITVGLLGVAWLITYYVAGQYIPFMADLGNWNILIGMGGMAAAFGIATLWK